MPWPEFRSHQDLFSLIWHFFTLLSTVASALLVSYAISDRLVGRLLGPRIPYPVAASGPPLAWPCISTCPTQDDSDIPHIQGISEEAITHTCSVCAWSAIATRWRADSRGPISPAASPPPDPRGCCPHAAPPASRRRTRPWRPPIAADAGWSSLTVHRAVEGRHRGKLPASHGYSQQMGGRADISQPTCVIQRGTTIFAIRERGHEAVGIELGGVLPGLMRGWMASGHEAGNGGLGPVRRGCTITTAVPAERPCIRTDDRTG